jgi:hypothetical protein
MAASITGQKGMVHSRALCRQVRSFFTSNSRSEGGAIFGHFSNCVKTSTGNSGTANFKYGMQGKESLDSVFDEWRAQRQRHSQPPLHTSETMCVDIAVGQTQSEVWPRFVIDDKASIVTPARDNDFESFRLGGE